ncbi:hypothetical protein ERJ75_001737900 [Trypanosoma vivax]|nr:hypothetical protein ERJ75_001737900 [Trypanosoma vivax]
MLWRSRSANTPFRSAGILLDICKVIKRFWSPFNQSLKGPDLRAYGFVENFNSIRTRDEDFTCQVNEHVGDAKLVEDFFIVLLCGFDFLHVNVERQVGANGAFDPQRFCGTYTLAHTRPFLGWRPLLLEEAPASVSTSLAGSMSFPKEKIDVEASVGNPGATTALVETGAGAKTVCAPSPAVTICIPFSAQLEEHEGKISHMILRSPAVETITAHEDCPVSLKSCLKDPEALRALVTLRRTRVRPDIITDRTLLGIVAKKEAWRSALGIL